MLSSAVTQCMEMGDQCSADHPDRQRRPRAELDDEIEEGEFIPGSEYSGSDTEDDARYVFKARDWDDDDGGRPEIKRRRLEDIVVGDHAAVPMPAPSSGSDKTISDDNAGATSAPAQVQFFPCPICQREFRSKKATHGHMKVHTVHDQRGRHGQEKGKEERPTAATNGAWAVTGKRGFVGGRAVSVKEEEVNDSMAIVVADPGLPVLDPMPIAFARAVHESRSTEQNPNESLGNVVAVDNPSNQVVLIDRPAVPQFVEHLPDAPQVDASQAPAPQPGAAEARCKPAPPARQEGWFCKVEGCNKWYATHQGLGGHMAGHKNRQNQAAAAAAEAGGSLPKPEKIYKCRECGRVQPTGVALGGHMRKHFKGQLGQKKRDAAVEAAPEHALALMAEQSSLEPVGAEMPQLALTLSPPTAPAMEAAPVSAMDADQQAAVAPSLREAAEPAPAPVTEAAQPATRTPAVAGVLRIFGINIVTAPSAEVSSTVTDAESSASASVP